MTGATDPAKAATGSIRRTLAGKESQARLRDVRTATNGVHCSAGPLEAMVEYSRFFSDHGKKSYQARRHAFGELLARAGSARRTSPALAKNPLVGEEGGRTTRST